MHHPGRPTTISELQDLMSRFRSPQSLAAGLSIAVRPTDVIIATFPKSGTTWIQQIVHAIRSRGSMDFEEICEVVPWLESAHDMGQDPDANQAWGPRVFKTHLDGERTPPGGRYLLAVRNPKSVVVSFHRFFDGAYFEAGSISLEAFTREWFMGGTASGRYWKHVKSWWPHVGRSDTLTLAYEDMIADHRGTVARIADFLGYGGDDGLIDLVVERSSRDFMLDHPAQFDDHLLFDAMHKTWGLPAAGSAGKVQTSGATPGSLDPQLEAHLDAIWRAEIEPALGFSSYEELRAAIGRSG
jgi:hypothetical protein